jgi:hypothetical protein
MHSPSASSPWVMAIQPLTHNALARAGPGSVANSSVRSSQYRPSRTKPQAIQ